VIDVEEDVVTGRWLTKEWVVLSVAVDGVG